jgi:hypothetical protein
VLSDPAEVPVRPEVRACPRESQQPDRWNQGRGPGGPGGPAIGPHGRPCPIQEPAHHGPAGQPSGARRPAGPREQPGSGRPAHHGARWARGSTLGRASPRTTGRARSVRQASPPTCR